MRKLLLFPLFLSLLLTSCSKDTSPILDLQIYAHGFWEAVEGDINIPEGSGLVVYNWYAIYSNTESDSVSVTWDDGRSCTTSPATMTGNTIEFSADGFNVKIVFDISNGATITFISNTDSYEKTLNKKREDPTVLCL